MADHVEQVIEAAATAAVEDAIQLVKSHPNYPNIVQALANKALDAIAAGL